LQHAEQHLKCINICIRGATPPNHDGIVLLQQLYTSIIEPLSNMLNNERHLTNGICGIINSMSAVLANVDSSSTSSFSSAVSAGKTFAIKIFNECTTKFIYNHTSYQWLQCISSLVKCISNELIPIEVVFNALSNIRQYIPNVNVHVSNPNYIDVSDTLWMEWITIMNELIHVLEQRRNQHTTIDLQSNGFFSAIVDGFNIAMNLCLPSSSNNNILLPPILQSRQLTSFLLKSYEMMMITTNDNNNNNSSSTTTTTTIENLMITLITKIFHHFCNPHVK